MLEQVASATGLRIYRDEDVMNTGRFAAKEEGSAPRHLDLLGWVSLMGAIASPVVQFIHAQEPKQTLLG